MTTENVLVLKCVSVCVHCALCSKLQTKLAACLFQFLYVFIFIGFCGRVSMVWSIHLLNKWHFVPWHKNTHTQNGFRNPFEIQ